MYGWFDGVAGDIDIDMNGMSRQFTID